MIMSLMSIHFLPSITELKVFFSTSHLCCLHLSACQWVFLFEARPHSCLSFVLNLEATSEHMTLIKVCLSLVHPLSWKSSPLLISSMFFHILPSCLLWQAMNLAQLVHLEHLSLVWRPRRFPVPCQKHRSDSLLVNQLLQENVQHSDTQRGISMSK